MPISRGRAKTDHGREIGKGSGAPRRMRSAPSDRLRTAGADFSLISGGFAPFAQRPHFSARTNKYDSKKDYYKP
ncbi:hypothetical protein V475_18150 [Sphingobium baderi LL03]|uniref:Uncharacterized protein n=1 Tax=Sphingobium baderi LL03 TaxID=1114964 RepID=T0GP19_9SPHN|nr:hypothetical protein L485_07970 [Sphingobium baderi LL03]KMS60730.1 hypothetical protein V475_18150 [Sphingobium baderi LL03]